MRWTIAFASVLVVAALGCNTLALLPTGVSGDTLNVAISRHGFDPVVDTVGVGWTVRWWNRDGTPHRVVTLPDAPVAVTSPSILPTFGWRHAFSVPGTYRYTCPVETPTDPRWQGVIVVR